MQLPQLHCETIKQRNSISAVVRYRSLSFYRSSAVNISQERVSIGAATPIKKASIHNAYRWSIKWTRPFASLQRKRFHLKQKCSRTSINRFTISRDMDRSSLDYPRTRWFELSDYTLEYTHELCKSVSKNLYSSLRLHRLFVT